ncbi:high mobility group B protein 15-like isoform X2 [Chenopodium quinoa]|uniref:high mobility group B protein 15-like isoform X2 n=1 Tax=Chenopodium quinoa TaxID=63459 RepID=UPI000B7991BB|nr:high mobility group B protein 15-like isoform X2 [Chenopodium quinoa]
MVGQGGNQYPAPLAKYEDVVSNRQLFMTTLESLHAAMATKFMIPVIGGRDLDLHKLFVEVTSRGGIEKILSEKRWKDVTATFNFPSTATNASFVLRKYYYSLLQHYERIYYFNACDYSPGVLQSLNPAPSAVHGLSEMSAAPTAAQPANLHQNQINTTESMSQAPSGGYPIIGVIDGKFESGYLVTVTIGKDKLKGVLYQTPPAKVNQAPQTSGIATGKTDNTPATSGVPRRRRRRRKKSEIRKRDPTHPKPNRSGYNFFFAEQHARLKPLHPGKDREISRMIGELWNKLKDSEKAVYQEKAIKDKERYRTEMEDYKERLRTNQVISGAIPIQQRFPDLGLEMEEVDVKDGTERDTQGSPEKESDSSKSDTNEEEEEEESAEEEDEDEDEDEGDDDDKIMEKEDEDYSDAETSPVVGGTTVESGNAGTSETAAAAATAGDFQVVKGEEKAGCEESEGSLSAGSQFHGETKQESSPNAEQENSIIAPAVT